MNTSKRPRSGLTLTEKYLERFEPKSGTDSLLNEMEAATHEIELNEAMGKYEEALEKYYLQKLAEIDREFDKMLKQGHKLYEKKFNTVLVGSQYDEVEDE